MATVSTRTKLVVSIGIILICGFMAINYANYYVSRNSVRDSLIHNELPLTSNNIYSEIQATLLRPIYISSLMAHDTFLKDWMLGGEDNRKQVVKYLREIRQRYDVFSTFVVSNLTKRYYHFSGVLKTVSPDTPKDSWFFSMEDHPEPYRVDVDNNEAADFALTIFINHKLLDYDGNFIGVTGIGLNAVGVSELIERYSREYHRRIYLVDASGIVQGHGQGRVVERVNIHDQPGISQVADELLSGRSGFLEYPLEGDKILLTYRYLPELDWYLVVEQPESAALQEIRRTFYVNTGFGLVIVVAVLLISGYTVNLFQKRLEQMAKTDKLTGLYNRQYFDAIYENAIKTAARRSTPLSVIVFDIDGFKHINDHHGHLVGDRVIRDVAGCARHSVRGSDAISRWGGDEFIVLLHDCDEGKAHGIAESIRTQVTEHVPHPETRGFVSISAGVAQYHPGDTYDLLLDRADNALYRAKENGRNQTCVARPSRVFSSVSSAAQPY